VAQNGETIQVASPAFTAMRQFCTTNSKATSLLHTAAVDYASARCLLLNGLVSGGLAMGAQAIEKFLKAHILLKNSAADVRKLKHTLPDLLNEADQLSPGLGLSKYSALMDRFWRHYQHRYPDNANASTSMTSEEIFELDEFIMFLNDNMACPFEAKYRTGLYGLVTFSLHHGRTVTPWEAWIKERNRALAPRWPQIEADFHSVLKNLYPATFG
jgi:HEPN domain-containing protein